MNVDLKQGVSITLSLLTLVLISTVVSPAFGEDPAAVPPGEEEILRGENPSQELEPSPEPGQEEGLPEATPLSGAETEVSGAASAGQLAFRLDLGKIKAKIAGWIDRLIGRIDRWLIKVGFPSGIRQVIRIISDLLKGITNPTDTSTDNGSSDTSDVSTDGNEDDDGDDDSAETTPETPDQDTASPTDQSPTNGSTGSTVVTPETRWGCVYSEQSPENMSGCDKQLLVLDPDAYEAEDVALMKKGGRKVVAYLSIGEAEEYRWYFSRARSLIIKENEEWQGNYPVRYWEAAWLKILEEYMAAIQAKGFDGLYYDVVDLWESLENRPSAKAEMARLVVTLCRKYKAKNPGALFFFQNSDQLFDDSEVTREMTGMIQEGLWYTWMDENISEEERQRKIATMARLRKLGKFIGLLEYTRKPEEMTRARDLARKLGFSPYFSTKELETLFSE